MTDFIVSARKYRPSSFNAVVGQSSIVLTLKNAIQSNLLAQSFLFCGPRGVGKTSCARILAKTINCFNISSDNEACNECESCLSFNKNTSFNIHELDAASNNSVDDIRNLVEQVRFSPQVGKYNIYIIDEVHMLSTSAFNAFLKTLEEPPSHAKFILATTEKNKIIPTILSRCQIFDFKRLSISNIASHLSYVAEHENINADTEALHLIAQKADGALRDALSFFDRLVSFSNKNLTYKSVIKHLNILDYDYYFRITDCLLENDINQILISYNEILENGFDGHHFINGLASHFRDILVSMDEKTSTLFEKGDVLKSRYIQQSSKCNLNFILSALSICNECDVQYKTTNNQRLLVEFTLMRISSIETTNNQKKKSKNFVISSHKSKNDISIRNTEEKVNVMELTSDLKKADKISQKSSLDQSLIQNKTTENTEIILDVNKKTTLISINSLTEESNIDKSSEKTVSNLRSSELSYQSLILHWKTLISFVKDQGKSNLAIALSLHEPRLLKNNVIELSLSNAAQTEIILEEKYKILEYLRNKLTNDHIEIITKVIEGEKSATPYTNKDKFNKMLENNSSLDSLRVSLGLDSDY